jgi:hypothetical protein
MKVRSESPNAWSLVLAAGLVACGAGSSLDDYSEGVPEVVPVPIRIGDGGIKDAGARDSGADSGRTDGGRADGGTQGGGQQGGQQGGGQQGGGGAAIGESCENADECLAGGECLTTVDLVIFQLNFPGGYCTKRPCSSDNDCPSGSGCQTTTMSCIQICTRNSECRSNEGYQCAAPPIGGGTAGGDVKYCLPNSVATIGGLAGGAGGTTGGFLAGLGGLLGGLGGAGGTR